MGATHSNSNSLMNGKCEEDNKLKQIIFYMQKVLSPHFLFHIFFTLVDYTYFIDMNYFKPIQFQSV